MFKIRLSIIHMARASLQRLLLIEGPCVYLLFSVLHRSILARNVGCLPNFADIFGGFGKVVACDYYYLRQAAVVTYASPKTAQAERGAQCSIQTSP